MDALLQEHQTEINTILQNIDTHKLQNFVEMSIEVNSRGNVIYWTGVGKSYNMANHTADMLKSIGFRSFAIRPIEALHGDMGSIKPGDIVVAFSKSGNTSELRPFMMYLNKNNIDIYGIFCSSTGSLKEYCKDVILLPCNKEIDNDFDLVPTTSMISFMLFCNMIVTYYLKVKNVKILEYGKNHPSGNIGQRVYLQVKDIMYPLADMCIIGINDSLLNCMIEMSSKKTGYAVCVKDINDKTHKIFGIVSDGDIRRFLTNTHSDPLNLKLNINASVKELMSVSPITINYNSKIYDIVNRLDFSSKINIGLPVINDNSELIGFIDTKILAKYSIL